MDTTLRVVGATAVFLLIALVVAACSRQASQPPTPIAGETAVPPTATSAPQITSLPDLGEAPEIENEIWLNADAPITLASQRGKVVLIEFWTFG